VAQGRLLVVEVISRNLLAIALLLSEFWSSWSFSLCCGLCLLLLDFGLDFFLDGLVDCLLDLFLGRGLFLSFLLCLCLCLDFLLEGLGSFFVFWMLDNNYLLISWD